MLERIEKRLVWIIEKGKEKLYERLRVKSYDDEVVFKRSFEY